MKNSSGFTLLELLLSLSIMLITLGITISGYQIFVRHALENTVSEQLSRVINFMRSTALWQNEALTLCPSKNKLSCTKNWSDGQLVFSVKNKKILQVFPQVSHAGILYFKAFPQSDSLTILASGYTASENGCFWYCQTTSAQPSFAVFINQAARIRKVYPDDKGNIYDTANKLLNCTNK